jgi:hypothetical protein
MQIVKVENAIGERNTRYYASLKDAALIEGISLSSLNEINKSKKARKKHNLDFAPPFLLKKKMLYFWGVEKD